MSSDSSLCEMMEAMHKDPLKKVEGLTIRKFYQLREHLLTCEKCSAIADEIIEKFKDLPDKPDSEWNKTQYN